MKSYRLYNHTPKTFCITGLKDLAGGPFIMYGFSYLEVNAIALLHPSLIKLINSKELVLEVPFKKVEVVSLEEKPILTVEDLKVEVKKKVKKDLIISSETLEEPKKE